MRDSPISGPIPGSVTRPLYGPDSAQQHPAPRWAIPLARGVICRSAASSLLSSFGDGVSGSAPHLYTHLSTQLKSVLVT